MRAMSVRARSSGRVDESFRRIRKLGSVVLRVFGCGYGYEK